MNIVFEAVADVQDRDWRETELRCGPLKRFRARLGEPDFTRHDDRVKPARELEPM
jgi:hypothetical protein